MWLCSQMVDELAHDPRDTNVAGGKSSVGTVDKESHGGVRITVSVVNDQPSDRAVVGLSGRLKGTRLIKKVNV